MSIIEKEPVTRLIISRWPVTISFSLLSLLFAVGLAIPIGVYSAIHRNRPFDHLGRVFALLGVSMPNFWVGLMLIILFAHRWHLLPSGGYVPINESFVGWLKSMVLPVVTLGTGQTALTMRMMRSCMLEVLHQDYVTTARAHGAPEWKVTWVHAFRNAFIPVLTVLGMNISLLLSGATVTEVVFALPGNGRLAYQALLNRDYPTLMGSTIIFALMYITSTFLVDIAYAFIDPRIKYE
ncbi:ABC transporter permease [Candidatus Bipolaricaulota bacterium]|nr:ABC transporter permease [Candidatus Bipolaricaulota bacterium]